MSRFWELLPHWIIAGATIWLAYFAYYAWDESKKGTAALQGQLTAIQTDQRPLLWVTGGQAVPVFIDETNQIRWDLLFANIGKGVAYEVTTRTYIKIGNERYQPGRNYGISAVELPIPHSLIIPPNVPQLKYTTVLSRPGMNKDFFNKVATTEFGVGVLIEFQYTDAAGQKFSNAICMERLASGALADRSPEDCPKDR